MVAYVAAVFAQVSGDAVCASALGYHSSPNGAGMLAATGVPKRGHMVNIDT
jgi:hypothetical protein